MLSVSSENLLRGGQAGGSELMNQALCPTWLGGAESKREGGNNKLGNSFLERRTGFIHKGVLSAWLGDVALGGKVDGKQHKPTV